VLCRLVEADPVNAAKSTQRVMSNTARFPCRTYRGLSTFNSEMSIQVIFFATNKIRDCIILLEVECSLRVNMPKPSARKEDANLRISQAIVCETSYTSWSFAFRTQERFNRGASTSCGRHRCHIRVRESLASRHLPGAMSRRTYAVASWLLDWYQHPSEDRGALCCYCDKDPKAQTSPVFLRASTVSRKSPVLCGGLGTQLIFAFRR
jgi:hypothetical protein